MDSIIIVVKESDQEYRNRMWQEYLDSLPKMGTKEYIVWRAAEREQILAGIKPYGWLGRKMDVFLRWWDNRAWESRKS